MTTSRRTLFKAGAGIASTLALTAQEAAAAPSSSKPDYSRAPNRYAVVEGRTLAYRSVGTGKPLVLFNRFRGTLDTWDPLFIDSLAAQGFQVITFDYSGLGLSTGEKSYNPPSLVKDGRDLILALGLKDVAVGGWSIGGIAAQIYLAMFGQDITHVVLIATTPPGKLVKMAEQLFYDTAAKPGIDLDQFTTVFFEPADEGSRAASKRSLERILTRKEGRAPDVDAAWGISQIGMTPQNPVVPSDDLLNLLKSTHVPILHLGADHDIIFPVENWYALNEHLPSTRLITFPKAGHGPQHQYPEEAALYIAAFLKFG
ncbi:alpha/beta fold hydrolase [Asticcacaulis excentricus]|uniref:Hydrolase, alpha/beta fold family n=1 Tax=Asticcacaulis excentricus TaxID=78587 RepID=A0A3G9G7R3_9CAUL|nr:alpha/beta hydrolase [Asticcacaulis excentricus]BBF82686.1 hydrolase, alpha/beta fold family [Asticcacaulis excentricus]